MTATGLLLSGSWTSHKNSVFHTVRSPYSGDALEEIVLASPSDTEAALESAIAGAALWRNTPAHQRTAILLKAASIADERVESLARTSMPFCLDTGHMWIGGTDPVAFAKDHGNRVGHVHFKDVRLDIAQRVRDGELSYYDAVTEGLYTPLGQGDVDVKGITSTLISQGYSGWFVLEQDNVMRQEPDSGGGPMVDAKASVEFLRAVAAEATV